MSCSYYVPLWGQQKHCAMSSAFQDPGWRVDPSPPAHLGCCWFLGRKKRQKQAMILHLQLRRGTSLPVTCPECVTWVSLTSPGQGSRILPQGRAALILSSSGSCHTQQGKADFLSAALWQLRAFHPCQCRLMDSGKDRSGILDLC